MDVKPIGLRIRAGGARIFVKWLVSFGRPWYFCKIKMSLSSLPPALRFNVSIGKRSCRHASCAKACCPWLYQYLGALESEPWVSHYQAFGETEKLTQRHEPSGCRESMKVKHCQDIMDFQKWNLQLTLSTDWTDWLMYDARFAGLSLRHVGMFMPHQSNLCIPVSWMQRPTRTGLQSTTVRDNPPLALCSSYYIPNSKSRRSIIDACGSTHKSCRFHQIRQQSSLAFPKGRRNDRPTRRVPVPSGVMAVSSCQNTKVLCYGNVKRVLNFKSDDAHVEKMCSAVDVCRLNSFAGLGVWRIAWFFVEQSEVQKGHPILHEWLRRCHQHIADSMPLGPLSRWWVVGSGCKQVHHFITSFPEKVEQALQGNHRSRKGGKAQLLKEVRNAQIEHSKFTCCFFCQITIWKNANWFISRV